MELNITSFAIVLIANSRRSNSSFLIRFNKNARALKESSDAEICIERIFAGEMVGKLS